MGNRIYPIGIQNFEKIRKEGYVYVDKTALMYKLVKSGSYFFLSRPRRFGKSLLISTLEAYFEAKRDLFEGLAVETLEKDWVKRPVLHLDLNIGKYDTPDSLDKILDRNLSKWEELYGTGVAESTLALRFAGVVERAYEQSGERVAILIDEYDKPLLQAIGNEELQREFCNTLKPFYGVLKTMDGCIKFALLTGVTKFGKVSVFSDLNNLNDISMDEEAPLQALIFDSVFNSFRGIIAYFKIVNGVIRKGDKVKFFNTGKEYDADEVGVLKMEMVARQELRTGDVGYIISGIKTSKEVKVGDTITHIARPCKEAIAGFEEVKPMVFAGVYPIEAEDFEDLRSSLEKLQLNDASLTFQPESSLALGFGFRCGFLGLLHMEIVQERLDREFDMNVITTVPNVSYNIYDKQGHMTEVHNPGSMPDPTLIDHIEEPYIRASVITTTDYIGPIMTLCLGKRGELVKQEYISGNRVEIYYDMPLGEIVIDFYDKLKSISKGYASFDYHASGFRPSKLVKLDILLNGEPVDALSTLTHFDNAYDLGRRMCEKLKDLIPRQQFDIAIQAAIGAKIISRETIKAVRKDVTAKCYGGDVSRKRKLLEKQKRGKKRMKQIGNVEVPQKAFLAVLKLD